MTEILRREIALDCPPAHAFSVFLDHIDLWWPRGHRKSGEGTLRFDGAAVLDIAPDGTQWTMAAVRVIEPPHRLALDWYPGSPLAPTQVEIGFEPNGDGTRITIVHQPMTPAAIEIWPQRLALFERGWEAVLQALNAHIGETNG